jgi:hypothetical protein
MTGTTFRYNSALLPEYITTIVISVLSTLMILNSRDNPLITHGNPHYGIASAIYAALALGLVWLTLHARWRWGTIWIDHKTLRGSFLGMTRFELWLSDVASIREETARFYGRRGRRLTIRSTRHDPVEIADAIYNYDQLAHILSERAGCAIEPAAAAPEVVGQLRARAAKRDYVFGQPRRWRILITAPVRAVGLLIVLSADLFFAFLIIFAFQGGPEARDPRAVYAGPVSLVAAAVTARFIYYRLSSSIRLNRTIRFRWRRLPPQPPPVEQAGTAHLSMSSPPGAHDRSAPARRVKVPRKRP